MLSFAGFVYFLSHFRFRLLVFMTISPANLTYVLEILLSYWYLTIPRCCLTGDRKEISASKIKTHVQGVQIMCSKRAKRVQSEEFAASKIFGCFV